jgi:outer membrane protein assembly factor BamE (lipoprotein component of BamABCDE complex)
MLPAPTQEDKVLSGKPVNDEQISFLKLEITTKEEVIERLGNPNIIREDAWLFVYSWDMRQGILVWAAGAHYTGGAGMKDIAKHYLLIIRFNEQGRVFDFTKTTRPLGRFYADFLTEGLKNSVDPHEFTRLLPPTFSCCG